MSARLLGLDKWAIYDWEQDGGPPLWDPHPGQLVIAESPARHKVASCGRRFGKSDVGGHELLPPAFVAYHNQDEIRRSGKRMEYWIVGPEYCTDEETQILTTEGWKFQHQLSGYETVLTQNPTTGLAEWQEIDEVAVFHCNHRYIYESEFRGHSSATTGEHRWLTEWGHAHKADGDHRWGYRFSTTDSLKTNERISCVAPVVDLPQEQKFTDDFVELMAWYWTEGTWAPKGKTLEIAQNEGPHLDRIEALLERNLGPARDNMRNGQIVFAERAWTRCTKTEGLSRAVRLSVPIADEIREWIIDDRTKAIDSRFIMALTQHQLELFIKISIWADADSDWNEHDDVQIGQKYEHNIDILQMAATLSGRRSQKIVKVIDGKPWYVLGLYALGRTHIMAGTVTQKAAKKSHSGVVWCPVTPNGTWMARRRGSVYFTGNSDAEKEFRVLWGLIDRLQMPLDRPGSYNDPIGGSMHISLWGGAYQVHCKSSKYPDQLVGERLRGVILAEAAKQKPSIWVKYVRPMLNDFKGWSLHTSTPEGKNHFHEKFEMGQNPSYPDWDSWRMPSWVNPYVYTETGRLIALGELPRDTPIPPEELTLDEHVAIMQRLMRENPNLSPSAIVELNNLQVNSEIADLAGEMSIEAFNQEIGADFTEFVGQVFKDYDENYHVGDLEFNPDWETYGACDYGFSNPNVWLLIQVGPWGEINVLREIYMSGLTDEEFADEIRRQQLNPPQLHIFYPDPEDPSATRVLEERLGIKANSATGGELRIRLNLIRVALKRGRTDLRGNRDRQLSYSLEEGLAYTEQPDLWRPQLMINRSCPNLRREMEAYRYPEAKDSNVETSVAKYENPLKKDDHAPEALGRFFKGYFGDGNIIDERSSGTRISTAGIATIRDGRSRRSPNAKLDKYQRLQAHEPNAYQYKRVVR